MTARRRLGPRPALGPLTVLASLAVMGAVLAFAKSATSVGSTRDGEPDTAFSADGVVFTEVTAAADFAHAVQTNPDGTLLVAGGTGDPAESLLLARYRDDGRLDPMFGSGGFAATPTGFDFFVATDIAVDGAGRALVSVIAQRLGATYSVGVVTRFTADGNIDTPFGTAGLAEHAVAGGNVFLSAVAVGADGAIVAAGGLRDDTIVVRLRDDGSPDPGFADAGRLVRSFGPRDRAHDVAVNRQGQVIVAGGIFDGESTPDDGFVTRLRTDGTVDSTFATAGVALTGFGPETETLLQIAIDRSGRIVGVGYVNRPTGVDIGLVRLRPDGRRDPTFGDGGTVLTSRGADQLLGFSLALQPDGRIVVGGRDDDATARGVLGLWRYLPNGSLDPTFGEGGEAAQRIEADADDLAIDARGRIIAVGSVDGLRSRDIVVARFSGQRSRCAGQLVTADLSLGVQPGRRRDVVLGTSAPDRINGGGGADVICGAGAADAIDGGRGRDLCRGGRGADTLRRCEEEVQ